jgi:peptide subunit release factor 1 (eRF1)
MFDEYGHSMIIMPPKKVKSFNYECGKRFNLDNILEMYNKDIVYGCVLACGKKYMLYHIIISGKHREYKLLSQKTVDMGTRHRRGGQSQRRYEHLYDEKYDVYIMKIAEEMHEKFVDMRGLIIAGPSMVKTNLISNKTYQKYFRDTDVTMITTDDINDSTINGIVDNFVSTKNTNKINTKIKMYLSLSNTDPDKLVFGRDEIKEGLHNCILKAIIVPKDDDDTIKLIEEHKHHDCDIYIDHDTIDRTFGIPLGIKYY